MSSIEETIDLCQDLILEKTGKLLSFIQKVILRESLTQTKKTYAKIAVENNYSENYIKQFVAPKLWQLLSDTVGEKVNRTNCDAVLKERLESLSSVNVLRDNQAYRRILELPEGSVPLLSPLYIERGIEQICYQEILQPGAFIRIKAPRKMGKTSLMARILAHADSKNYHTVRLSLYRAETEIFASSHKFLQWLCANINLQLGLKSKISDFWDEDIGALMNCTIYVQECLLNHISSPLVLALDQVEQLFDYPNLARDFFALLRSWYEETRDLSIWRKLRLLIVNSTDTYLNFKTNKSPFNIGLAIELPPFTGMQVEDLAKRHRLQLTSSGFDQLMELTGGVPYLVRLALYHSLQHQIFLETLMQNATSDTGIFSSYLHELLWHLKKNPDLAIALSEVVLAQAPVTLEQEVAFKLKSLGLVNLKESKAMVSCGLYQQYFSTRVKELIEK
ncbi:MAG: AAA-like domain-containing protein [Calothrix sp. FI2-JRJ7]|jgi:GTPase SAR1 family protein|nr:AAA-like domain-containing protein [Calothrix sp. FI2-JRJ7]